MPITSLDLPLSPCQLKKLTEATRGGQNFALMAQPWVDGHRKGTLEVYILTPEQFDVLAPATRQARDLPAFVREANNGT
jgi:hypothetical protein